MKPRLHNQLFDILHEDIDYYPSQLIKLTEELNENLESLKTLTDNSTNISKKYLNEEITKEEKDNTLNEYRIDLVFINRKLKELILKIQDKAVSYNAYLLGLSIGNDITEPDKVLLPTLTNVLKELDYDGEVDIVRQIDNYTFRVLFQLNIPDLLPEMPPQITDNLEEAVKKLNEVEYVSNMNYNVLRKNPNIKYNLIINLDITVKENLG